MTVQGASNESDWTRNCVSCFWIRHVIRHDLLHEGIVGDLPVGHTVIEADCMPEMMEFAEKLILSLLGVKAGYLKTSGGDRQRHTLDLKK